MALETKRSAKEYERELRRREVVVGESLTRILPTDRPASPQELAGARRALVQGLRDLRQLRRELTGDLRALHARRPGREAGAASSGRGGGDRAERARRREEVLAYEGVRDEIDEVLSRWERRAEQLAAAAERQR